MSAKHFDVVVIGSGPGGEGAAMKLVKSGKRVAVIEAHDMVGGGCTHWGTIPSKALRHNIQLLRDYRRNPLFQHTHDQVQVEYSDLLKAAGKVINQQVRSRLRHYARNRIDVIHGRAGFIDTHRIEIVQPSGVSEEITAEHFVIATGSRPYQPADIDFNHPRILDSDSVLRLDTTPDSITIYGAGVIGCEYASIFCNLDVKVNLVNTRDRLLSFLDDEITDALSYHLRNQGTVIRHDEVYEQVEAVDDGGGASLQVWQEISRQTTCCGPMGAAVIRKTWDWDEIGVAVNHRGQIEIDKTYATSLPHIYAVGDVVGPPALASASYDQGRFVGAQIATGSADWQLIDDFPTGIYTLPEISSIGRTERELTASKVPYEVGQASFRTIARAQITDHEVGMLKLLFHRETLEILGIHCFGEQASEIVHIGQAIMAQQGEANSLLYFAETTFNYPTMAEAYRVAALNGLNRIF